MSDEDAEAMADVMRVLADGTRLAILLMLAEAEANVTSIRERLGCPQPTASHHLALLKMAGMVESRREGKRIFYRLASKPPEPAAVRVSAGASVITVELSRSDPASGGGL